ncbi:LANO_0D07382g1_1 [Lachancea nothofagi CBS 11611]|uniref:Aldehyde dehydrogenase n=1 Tax=Lachancea nothofagi CBS 11611 TaxID=1266666 RepID=A0A1G4JIG2_9SACH|nr:LANO_0D07382g1_1 [Lachancea nothofagi CBS 11611]
MSEASSLQYTPLQEIDSIVAHSKECYHERQVHLSQTKNPRATDLKLRLKELQSLYFGLKDHEDEIVEALKQDFNRSRFETFVIELIPLYNNILHVIDNLPKRIQPQKIAESGRMFKLSSVNVEQISLGSVLVISPFNYPVLLSLDPIAAAIACGNSVVWKPSEMTPATAAVLEKILVSSVSSSWIKVVQGAVQETSQLIKNPNFDKIFYTGSTRVGRIVAQEAAKNLIPVTLELGGKSPVFITEHLSPSNLKKALKRTFFGAFSNSGQTCVSSDYMLVHESKLKQVKELTAEVLDEFWPQLHSESDVTSMINDAAYEKTIEKLDATKGNKIQPSNKSANLPPRFIPPTVIFDVEWQDSLMKGENFSPVLAVITYRDLDNVIEEVIKNHRNPLALYVFSQDQQEINQILTMVKSGGCIINDTMIHVAASDAPFGGIRESGHGSYHGKWSFAAFSHERTVIKQPFWTDFINNVRNPPYTSNKLSLAQATIEVKPSFRRDGARATLSGKYVMMAVLAALVAITGSKIFQKWFIT